MKTKEILKTVLHFLWYFPVTFFLALALVCFFFLTWINIIIYFFTKKGQKPFEMWWEDMKDFTGSLFG